MNLWFGTLKVNYLPGKFDGHKLCRSGDIIVLVCHVISQDHMMKQACNTTGKSPLRQVTILQNLAAIFASGVIMILVCHVISQDHVIKRSCDFMGGSPSS